MKQVIKKINYILSQKEKRKIGFLVVQMVIGGLLELLGVAGIFPLINLITNGDVTELSGILLMSLSLIALYILKNTFLLFMYRSIYRFVYTGRSELATRLFGIYMTEPYAFHLNRNIAIIQRAVRSDVDGFYNLVKALLQMLSEIIICVVLSVLLFLTDFKMACMLVLLLGACVGSVLMISKKKVKKLGEEDMQYNTGMNQWLLQGIGGIKEIKLLHNEDYFIQKFRKLSEQSSANQGKQQLLIQTPRLLTETVSIAAVLLWIILLSVRQTNLQETIPTLAVFAVSAFRLLPSVGKINGLLAEYQFYKSRVDFIYEDIRDAGSPAAVAVTAGQAEDATRMEFHNEIAVREVTFSYDGEGKKEILHAVSARIPRGASVGIIGPSGAGKTTFVDIVMGLLKADAGEITVDGRDINTNLPGWYALLGYVPQVIYLSDDTIKKNIAFGIPEEEIKEDRIYEVLREARLLEVIENMKDGINTVIGERGVRLSGGQRQRIGIARALYHNPEVLILDEATSSLDHETEAAVMSAIEALHGKITMIVIAHRLSTIRSCDRIYRVSGGSMEETTLEEQG